MTPGEITKYLFLEDQDQRGDIAIVFGVRDWMVPLKKALQLYSAHRVPTLLFTGGVNRHSGEHEAQSMAQEALKEHVPSESILVEDKATNTQENILFSKDLLDLKIGLQHIHSICAVTMDFHARRAFMTLKRYFPSHIQFKACPYSYARFGFNKDTWQLSEKGREVVGEELDKIKEYLAKGDIVGI